MFSWVKIAYCYHLPFSSDGPSNMGLKCKEIKEMEIGFLGNFGTLWTENMWEYFHNFFRVEYF